MNSEYFYVNLFDSVLQSKVLVQSWIVNAKNSELFGNSTVFDEFAFVLEFDGV